jgi:hypothetical protein
MIVANAWLEIADTKSNVRIANLTPAEALILRKEFGAKVPGTNKVTNPFHNIEVAKEEIKRTDQQEIDRLSRKYGNKKVADAFPGENPTLPKDFSQFADVPKGEPAKAELHEIPPLTSLHDDGADLEPNALADAQKEIAALKAKLAQPKV